METTQLFLTSLIVAASSCGLSQPCFSWQDEVESGDLSTFEIGFLFYFFPLSLVFKCVLTVQITFTPG